MNKNIEIQFAPVYLDISKPLAPSGVNSEHYNDLLSYYSEDKDDLYEIIMKILYFKL